MSDAITAATRMNWAEHQEKCLNGLAEASFQLGRIAMHVGRPDAARAERLQQKVQRLTLDVKASLERLLAVQTARVERENPES